MLYDLVLRLHCSLIQVSNTVKTQVHNSSNQQAETGFSIDMLLNQAEIEWVSCFVLMESKLPS